MGRISAICTDANSCYHLAFERIKAGEPHRQTKAQTPFRRVLERLVPRHAGPLNRKTNHASKTYEMLWITLGIFLARKHLASLQ